MCAVPLAVEEAAEPPTHGVSRGHLEDGLGSRIPEDYATLRVGHNGAIAQGACDALKFLLGDTRSIPLTSSSLSH